MNFSLLGCKCTFFRIFYRWNVFTTTGSTGTFGRWVFVSRDLVRNLLPPKVLVSLSEVWHSRSPRSVFCVCARGIRFFDTSRGGVYEYSTIIYCRCWLAKDGLHSNAQVRMRRKYSSMTVKSYVPKKGCEICWWVLKLSFLLKTALYLTEWIW